MKCTVASAPRLTTLQHGIHYMPNRKQESIATIRILRYCDFARLCDSHQPVGSCRLREGYRPMLDHVRQGESVKACGASSRTDQVSWAVCHTHQINSARPCTNGSPRTLQLSGLMSSYFNCWRLARMSKLQPALHPLDTWTAQTHGEQRTRDCSFLTTMGL